MKHIIWALAFFGFVVSPAQAAPVSFFVDGTTAVTGAILGSIASGGSYQTVGDYPTTAGGDTIQTQFLFDTNIINALSSTSADTPRLYSAAAVSAGQQMHYVFNTDTSVPNAYRSYVTNPTSTAYIDTDFQNFGTTPASSSLSLTVYNNVAVDFLTAGVFYDQLTLVGSATNPYGVGNTHTWQLDLYGNSSWLSGTGIPTLTQLQSFRTSVVDALFYMYEADPTGAVVGEVSALNGPFTFSATSVAAVPVPAAVWLLGSGLIGLVAVGRRRQEV